MLVLSRHRDEKIIIGDNIIVTVVDIRRDRVRLGITAPAHIPVHREEVYEAIQREKRAAARKQKESAQATDKAADASEAGTEQPEDQNTAKSES